MNGLQIKIFYVKKYISFDYFNIRSNYNLIYAKTRRNVVWIVDFFQYRFHNVKLCNTYNYKNKKKKGMLYV